MVNICKEARLNNNKHKLTRVNIDNHEQRSVNLGKQARVNVVKHR